MSDDVILDEPVLPNSNKSLEDRVVDLENLLKKMAEDQIKQFKIIKMLVQSNTNKV